MGFSTDGAQLGSFSCSPPPDSSSSSKPGVRWSLARVPSTTGSGLGSMSSSWRPRTWLGKGTLSCQVTGAEKSESVCVHLSVVAGSTSDFDGTEPAFTVWPFTLVTMLPNSWLEILRKTGINTRETQTSKKTISLGCGERRLRSLGSSTWRRGWRSHHPLSQSGAFGCRRRPRSSTHGSALEQHLGSL